MLLTLTIPPIIFLIMGRKKKIPAYLTSILVFFVIWFFTALVTVYLPSEEFIYRETKYKIVSLSDTQKSFFLNSNTLDRDTYYYCVVEADQGFQIKKVFIKNTYIKYGNEPCVVTRKACDFKHFYNFIWAFPIDTHHIIYIPRR